LPVVRHLASAVDNSPHEVIQVEVGGSDGLNTPRVIHGADVRQLVVDHDQDLQQRRAE